MKRCNCGSEIWSDITDELLVETARRTFVVPVSVRVCEECGRRLLPLEAAAQAELRVAAWLAVHGVRDQEVFRFMRKALGLRGVDLAELLDVTPETISRWERGALPTEQRAFALLAALVCERVEGRVGLMAILRAARQPPEVPPTDPIMLPPSAAA